MASYVVGQVGELQPGERKIVDVAGRSIGVFNVGGRYFAIRNRCPHQSGPLCLGQIIGLALPTGPGEYQWGRDGEIIRCPWHGWEFDLTTGLSITNPVRKLVKQYEVSVVSEMTPQAESYPVKMVKGQIVVEVKS
jgi:3-phenylpropionate/trans-cinnamate dioxygenase ferredoxin subunit